MACSGHGDVVLKEDGRIYKKGDKFKSFHIQMNQPIFQKALIAGFLSVWLKKCVIPYLLHDEITLLVLFPAI